MSLVWRSNLKSDQRSDVILNLPICQLLSVRLVYEGNQQIIKITNTTNEEFEMISTYFGINFPETLVMIFGCALLAL